jgi:hypothetical protein
MINTKIIGSSSNYVANVTDRGQLVVAPISYSNFYSITASVINTAYNVVPPKSYKKFVITDMIIAADRDVSSTNGAIISVYEATGPTVTAVSRLLYQDEITKLGRAIITGMNIITSENIWINLKTDDSSVRINMGGYYVIADGAD